MLVARVDPRLSSLSPILQRIAYRRTATRIAIPAAETNNSITPLV